VPGTDGRSVVVGLLICHYGGGEEIECVMKSRKEHKSALQMYIADRYCELRDTVNGLNNPTNDNKHWDSERQTDAIVSTVACQAKPRQHKAFQPTPLSRSSYCVPVFILLIGVLLAVFNA
jgi:hypothetical protein